MSTVEEAEARTAGRKEWLAFAVLAIPLLLVSMDVSILYFAVPEISRDLHASPTQQLWIFDIYGFVLAGLLVTMGAVADRIGARRLLLAGALAFSATSVFAAYAGSAGQLIAARAVLGIAGATLMPSTLSMIRSLFPDETQRGRAVGAWTGVMTAGVGLGPVLSGFLLDHFWWGSVFLVNLPAMALLMVVGPLLLPRVEARPGRRFDVTSSVLSLGAVLPTIYGIKEWAVHGTDVRWLGCIALGVSLGVMFARRQLRHPEPMVAPALLRNPLFRAVLAGNVVSTFALVGNAVFMTSYLQLVLGYDPLAAALWSLVPTVGVGLTAPFASTLGLRFGRAATAAGGLGLGAVGFVVLTGIGAHSLVSTLIGAGVLAAGLVLTMTICAELVLAALSPEEAGAGAAVSEAASELGGALGIALLGSIGAAAYQVRAADTLPGAVAGGPASDSLAGAAGVAARLPDATAAAVLDAARAAYVHGIHVAAAVGATVLLVAALATARARLSEAERAESGARDRGGPVDHGPEPEEHDDQHAHRGDEHGGAGQVCVPGRAAASGVQRRHGVNRHEDSYRGDGEGAQELAASAGRIAVAQDQHEGEPDPVEVSHDEEHGQAEGGDRAGLRSDGDHDRTVTFRSTRVGQIRS
jgi:MFS transporter, DHA2 family, multidrug resistance protein